MAKAKKKTTPIDDLLQDSANQERRLLKRERKAEQRLATLRQELILDQERLTKAQERVTRRTEAIATAEKALQETRAARAAGPSAGDTPTAAPSAAEAHPPQPINAAASRSDSAAISDQPAVQRPAGSRARRRTTTAKTQSRADASA